MTTIPPYVPGHNLLEGKNVLVTAAAGTGIGFAAAKKAIEEGARLFISDIHEGRLQKAVETIEVKPASAG
ncbi:SDR family NAD(P)-dependent oxidoreductase [Pseudidiomarina halophila]|uniref:SDR family NAD(P)-dependent oxidoreductase n=1 Tax=Pseudidiomarina halophila TaxID=1449799 RepID=UPI003609C649